MAVQPCLFQTCSEPKSLVFSLTGAIDLSSLVSVVKLIKFCFEIILKVIIISAALMENIHFIHEFDLNYSFFHFFFTSCYSLSSKNYAAERDINSVTPNGSVWLHSLYLSETPTTTYLMTRLV